MEDLEEHFRIESRDSRLCSEPSKGSCPGLLGSHFAKHVLNSDSFKGRPLTAPSVWTVSCS